VRIICRKHFEETVKERQTIKLDHFPRVGGADIAGLRENKRRYALAMALGAAFGLARPTGPKVQQLVRQRCHCG
jgi:hypothetical protein